MDEIMGGTEAGSPAREEEDSESARTKVPLWKLFAHSDWVDKLLVVMGSIGCIADGACTPLIMLVLSRLYNDYATSSSMISITVINKETLNLLYVALGVGTGAFLGEGACWARTAERQTSSLRTEYLTAILRQDVGYFDLRASNSTTFQVVSTVSTNTQTIQDALSEKIPNFLMNMATFFTAQMVAFYLSWRLSLVTLPILSLLIVPGIIYGKMLMEIGKKMHEAYGVAGGTVEQALSSIRTVHSYVGESQTEQGYSMALNRSLVLGLKQGMMKGMAIGSIGIGFAVWAFQAWYGSVLVIDHGEMGGDVYNAGVCVVVGGLALGGALANLKCFSEAAVAAGKIFELIERVPSIDLDDQQGEIMQDVQGEIEFKDVEFAYPSRPNGMILQKFNLTVMAGKTMGLVGGSGSGKSTVISLIERFYDPLAGEILLDGKNIKSLQLKWLRSQIGLVSQEPVLFATSIKENIMFGKEGATMELVVSAAKAANAHNFIDQLPNGYDTQVGQFGLQMSGGQKQRIAIARALLKDPRILLLDEATSALDSQSEKVVQDALDQASKGQTTIIVAHRLSTLRNADMIIVLQSGQVVESGSHDQLIQSKNGAYSTMVQLQNKTLKDEEASTPKESKDDYPTTSTAETSIEISNRSGANTSFCEEDQIRSHQEDNYSPPSIWFLLKMTSPQWKNSLLGCLGAICFGGVQPLHSFVMGGLLSTYFFNDNNQIRSQTRFFCLVALTYALFSFITSVIQHYNFGVMGEHLTKKLREAILAKVLTFEIGWFDQENNTSGAICARLGTQANMVRSLVCDRLSLLSQVISGASIALAMSFTLSWRLSIAIIALQPLIIGSFYGKGVLMKNMSSKLNKAQDRCSQLASDAVTNHRTITSFSSQEKIKSLFKDTLTGPRTESKRQSWVAGFGLFISQFSTAANVGLIFWYAGHLLHQGRISYKHVFQTFFILVTTGRVIAEAGMMTSDIVKGVDAIKSIFMILDRKTKIDPGDPEGIKPEKIYGYLELKEVMFSYPSRPEQMILKGLTLKIESGKTVSLVGQSGSGKSTIIGLIERFYDPLRGSIEIDFVDIKRYNLRSLRAHIALVSQEPTLFAGTIHANIIYGKDNATEAEVIEAATVANAHEFISCMKDGYETSCGERGVQLSGGQKQRIALARAILKNPAILLLDEATSALDSKSEGLVQEAIEKMMAGRTCIVVAHRLATIQKSDSIAVIENGKIVEEGSHSKLIVKGDESSYFSLVKLQRDANFETKIP